MLYPHATLLGEVAVLCVIYMLQPEAYTMMLRLMHGLSACISLLAVVLVSLFCVAVPSRDVAYLLVRMAVPEDEVWTEAARFQWALAWSVTWLLQVPMWLYSLRVHSPLLVHERANLMLTLHHALLRQLGSHAVCFPSATLVAATENSQRASVATVLAVRCSLPMMYVLCHGVPTEWRQVALFFLFDIAQTFCTALAYQIRAGGPRMRLVKPPWQLDYPPAHGEAVYGDCQADTAEDCTSHGMCSICLSNLCCPGGGAAAAGIIAAAQRRVGPSLSAARLRPRLAAGLSAARVTWGAGRIATTKCGHSFHAQCLVLASEALPRCPHCRAGLQIAEHGLELPSEDVLDAQMLCLAFGLLLGGSLLFTHWVLWDPKSPIMAAAMQLQQRMLLFDGDLGMSMRSLAMRGIAVHAI